MIEALWSRYDGQDCIRVVGAALATIGVRPAAAVALRSAPTMAGRFVADSGDVCFVPRFGFVDGTTYTVTVSGTEVVRLHRPAVREASTTDVVGIGPTVSVVPRNLLRCYVTFSAPMSDGEAAAHVRLVDGAGEPLPTALLPVEYELWDAAHQRLTVLLDPARIKRGLVGHVTNGYPLRSGETVRLVVDPGFRDARGVPLRRGGERSYQIGDDLRGRVDPESWQLTVVAAGGREPLVVDVGRPLDHALVRRCLRIVGPDGDRVDGRSRTGDGELSWHFTPTDDWQPGSHRLVVDPVLEDIAGNSVLRVFDRDLAEPDGGTPTTELLFAPR
ncbi:hypothetical protein ACWGBX_07275 [Streptomyces sp. NPDC055037]